jgi:hypothetical protein
MHRPRRLERPLRSVGLPPEVPHPRHRSIRNGATGRSSHPQHHRHGLNAFAVARPNQSGNIGRAHPCARLVTQGRQKRCQPNLKVASPTFCHRRPVPLHQARWRGAGRDCYTWCRAARSPGSSQIVLSQNLIAIIWGQPSGHLAHRYRDGSPWIHPGAHSP